MDTPREIYEVKDHKLAVLIDADNISYQYVKPMMDEIARYGVPTIKRIYGDWTKQNMNGWKTVLLDYAIQPIQQFGYTYGKNSTDTALIIDAMDILYTYSVDGFCLVSSDSDFTRLAMRLREAGKQVIGIGEQKTPNAFIAACNRFLFLEILNYDEDDPAYGTAVRGIRSSDIPAVDTPPTENLVLNAIARQQKAASRPAAPAIRHLDDDIVKLIHSFTSTLADDSGWAFLGDLGNMLLKTAPSFDPRNYGYSKLSNLIRDVKGIEVDERPTANQNVKHIYIRLLPQR